MHRVFGLLKNLGELVMFKHTIFSLPFIFIAMVVSANGWFGWDLLLLGLLAATSARNFAMGVNRYADRDIDAKNPRTQGRPSVDGRVTKRGLILFIAFNGALFVTSAYAINGLAFALAFPILAVLASYSYFKRFSHSAHLVLGLSLALAPIAGVVAVEAGVTLWSVLLALGVLFWVAGFDLLYALQDMEFDKKEGLFSVPSQFGAPCTLFVSKIFHALSVLFWLLFVVLANLSYAAYGAVLVSAAMLWFEHRIVARDFSKIDRAFFTVNGYLGIIFLALIVLDRILYGA